MKFNVSYQSVVLIIAKDIDAAVQKVVDLAFDQGDASMPIVLNVEVIDEDDEDEEEEDSVA